MQDQMHSQIINTKDINNLFKCISELYKQTWIFFKDSRAVHRQAQGVAEDVLQILSMCSWTLTCLCTDRGQY